MKAHLLSGALLAGAFLAAVLGLPAQAWAQRMPHADANAAGADVGVFAPQQSGMGSGLDIGGFFEHYLDSRDSIRGEVGWMQAMQDNDSTKSVRQIRVGGDLIHNWEGGALHPFVGAGLGLYFVQPRVSGSNNGNGATRFGGNILGGLEFFTAKTFAVKAEARYHVVQGWNGYDPSGFALTIGLKSYF
jgi:opacity protein-like surface antigen